MSEHSLIELLDLSGNVAIVTGSGRGIGQAIALRLAEAGAKVLVSDVSEAFAAETVAQINSAGGHAGLHVADVSEVAAASATVQIAIETFGRLDILVNNAALFPPTPALDISEDQWDRVLDVNLKGAFFFAQAAARAMIAGQRGGKIVNVASLGYRIPPGMLSHYDTSKGGMVSMTQSLAKELGPHGIRVNALAPGAMETPGGVIASATIASTFDIDLSTLPMRAVLGRFGTGDDVAKAAIFLASGLSDYVTGSVLDVGGGYQLY